MRPILAIFTLFALAVAGCGGADHGAETLPVERYEGPIGSSDIELGADVYQRSCNGCHPGGERGYGPALANHPHPVAEVRKVVREGQGKMPSFGEEKISHEQLEALLAYLDTIGGVSH